MNTTNKPTNDESLSNVRMIFQSESGETVLWNPEDCTESGTPIEEETGDDLEYIGLCRVDDDGAPIESEDSLEMVNILRKAALSAIEYVAAANYDHRIAAARAYVYAVSRGITDKPIKDYEEY